MPPRLGFALVDIVVTLALIFTLAGMAGLYYTEIQKERVTGIVQNELDTYAKALTSWETVRRRELTMDDVLPAMTKLGREKRSCAGRALGTLDFLVEEGRFSRVTEDPWRSDYFVDPGQGIVFSPGPDQDPCRTADNVERYFRKASARAGLGTELPKDLCIAPPLIATYGPRGLVSVPRPVLRVTYFPAAGCAIDAKEVRLFLRGPECGPYRGQEVTAGVAAGAGQLTFTPPQDLCDGEYSAIVAIKDAARPPHETRQQWTFLVDRSPPTAVINSPGSGRAVSKEFPVIGAVIARSISQWVLNWDFRVLRTDVRLIGRLNAQGEVESDVLLDRFDTLDPTNPVEDGRHFLTLVVTNTLGQKVTAQNEVLVDNTPPRVSLTRRHPGATGDPMTITTTIPILRGIAQDNLLVREVRFKTIDRNTGQAPSGQPAEGTTAVPIGWDPRTALENNTVGNWGVLFNAPVVEFSTIPSIGTTADWPRGGFRPVSLPQGQYTARFSSKDLAGNESTLATTDFDVNLNLGGLAAAAFLNQTAIARGQPFGEDDRHITSLAPPGVPNPAGSKPHQATGKVRFVILEAGRTPASTWEVILDDNGGTATRSGDGQFVVTGTGADWVSVGRFEGVATGVPIVSAVYEPSGNDPAGRSNTDRRRSATNPDGVLGQGIYKVRVRYTNDAGETRSTVTTFLVDNTPPLLTDAALRRLLCPPFPSTLEASLAPVLRQNQLVPALVTALCGGATLESGFVEVRGTARDQPTTGVVSYVGWHVARFSDAPGQLQPPGCGPFLTAEVPGLEALGIFKVRTEPTADVPNAAYTLAQGGAARNTIKYSFTPTVLTTSIPGGLDGRGYLVRVVSVDGAGLTSCLARWFTVNTVGPILNQVTLTNQVGGPASIFNQPTGDAPTPHTLEGDRIQVTLNAVDEVNLRSVRFNIFETTGTAGLPQTAAFSGTFTAESRAFVITRSDDGRPLKPLPTTYRLLLVATNVDGQDGPTFETRIGLQYVANLAIVAPYYVSDQDPNAGSIKALADANAVWIGSSEQTEMANFVFDRVRTAATKRVYDYAGNLKRTSVAGDALALSSWLADTTSNKTTDALVVVDMVPSAIFDNEDLSATQRFLESKSTDPAKSGNTRDGDTIVWVGEVPFYWVCDTTGVRRRGSGLTADSSGKAAGHRRALGFSPVSGVAVITLTTTSTDSDPDQVPAPVGSGSAYLPDLPGYAPFLDFQTPPGRVAYAQLKNVATPVGPLAGSNYALETLFTVDSGKLAAYATLNTDGTITRGTAAVSGNNILLRNKNSSGVLAAFLGIGPAASTDPTRILAGKRDPVPPAGPVLVDFIDGFLLNQSNPRAASKRILFNSSAKGPLGHGGADGRDLIAWPGRDEGYTNVTKLVAPAQDASLTGQSGNQVATFISQDQTQIDARFRSNSPGLFVHFGQPRSFAATTAISVAHEQPIANNGIVEAAVAANGTVVAYTTLANLRADPSGALALERRAVFVQRVGGTDRRQITTGVGLVAVDAVAPAVAADGDYVVFASRNVYSSTLTFPNAFKNLTSTSGRRIYRYTFGAIASDPSVYQDGEVVADLLGAGADCDSPSIARGGRFVPFVVVGGVLPGSGSANPVRQVALAFNARPGQANPWVIGALTRDTSAESSLPHCSADTVLGMPFVVFQSRVDYANRLVAPDASGNPQDVAPKNLDTVPGALSSGGSTTTTFVAIYLYAGTTTRPLLRIAAGSDDDCTQPRISPDAAEVVFESRASRVTGFVHNNLSAKTPVVLAQTVVNPGVKRNRVYRVRLRADVPPGNGFAAVVERISPVDVDLGAAARPQVSN